MVVVTTRTLTALNEVTMSRHAPFGRVILLVLDGLRPDAIPRFGLHHIAALSRRGASTMLARTVSPSVTAAAMASLLTGAPPAVHGVATNRFHLPRPRGPVDPLPRTLARAGYSSSIFISAVPFGFHGLAQRISAHLGFTATSIGGRSADDVLGRAIPTLQEQRRGLVMLHWADADRAGHAHGWMSEPYADATRVLDGSVGSLLAMPDVVDDPSTLLIALADHGGGGMRSHEHDGDHPLDHTIPIMLSGARIRSGDLGAGHSILDLPPTICWALGIARPESHAGRALSHAFADPRVSPELAPAEAA